MPQSNAYLKPAAVSAAEGSNGAFNESANGKPAGDEPGAARVAVGAMLRTVTVACFASVRPPSSVTRTATVGAAGPSAAANVAVCPGVSNVPSPFRSHAYVSGPPSGSVPVAANVRLDPSPTVYGPPAPTLGGSLRVIRATDGSWSDAWSANSALACTTSKAIGRAASASLTRTWSSVCEFPSKT